MKQGKENKTTHTFNNRVAVVLGGMNFFGMIAGIRVLSLLCGLVQREEKAGIMPLSWGERFLSHVNP